MPLRAIQAANQTAISGKNLAPRDFIWMVARNRATGAAVSDGFWSDVGDISAQVINPDTGLAELRSFGGAGQLLSASEVPMVANLTVQEVTIEVSHIDTRMADLLRTHDLKLGKIELYRGFFDPGTGLMFGPAECRFNGFVNTMDIITPPANQYGRATLHCVSFTQEMNRYNTDMRSHESQKLRDPTDDFFADTATIGEVEHFWGKSKGTVPTAKQEKPWWQFW